MARQERGPPTQRNQILARVVAASPFRQRWPDVGVALGGPPLRAVQREPQAGRGHLVLRVPRAPLAWRSRGSWWACSRPAGARSAATSYKPFLQRHATTG